MKSKRMTRQRSFNRFYKHFVVEGNLSCKSEGGSCMYRLEPNAHWELGDPGCGIGIQPEFQAVYKPTFESTGIETLWNTQAAIKAILREKDVEFFTALQALHDVRRDSMQFEAIHVPNFIEEWKLNVPKSNRA